MDTTWKERIPRPIRSTPLWSLGAKVWRARRRIKPPRFVSLMQNFAYDARRYARYAVPESQTPEDQEALSSHLTFHYHKLEKGLSLPNPRPGFGAEAIKRVMKLVRAFESRFGKDDDVLRSARGAVRSVVTVGAECGHQYEGTAGFLSEDANGETGGALTVTRDEIHAHSLKDLSGFFAHRHSVRDFEPGPVDPELIARALAMAQKAPSVCNRQSGRAHVFTTPAKMTKALSYQNGNRGFGHAAGAVIILTSDLRSFVSAGERNQCWVDGGLFAMSLNYALHSLGLGVCMLNWSMEAEADKKMRKAMGIPDYEAVITMMGVGHLPERLKVAQSHRRPLSEIARFDARADA